MLSGYGVKVYNGNVVDILVKDNKKKILFDNKKVLECDSVSIATGGVSYPLTGSTGDGYKFAKKLGHTVSEIKPSLVPMEFKENYVNIKAPYSLTDYTISSKGDETFLEVTVNDETIKASGNGPLDALCEALKKHLGIIVEIDAYSEHALESKSSSQAISYIAIKHEDNVYWGAGIDSNINTSSIYAFISAVNRLKGTQNENE